MDRRTFLHFLTAAAASPALSDRAFSDELPRHASVPGGVAVVNLGPEPSPPLARFNGERVLVAGDASGWYAVVGIPLDAKVGAALPLTVERAEREPETIALEIGRKRYATQHLSVRPEQVELSPADLARHEQERAHLRNVLRTFSESAPDSLLLLQPCEGRRSDSFGKRRFFNRQPRSPHNGLDIAAPDGTPVVAAGAGNVLDIGDYFFSGRTLILDHGRGFLTLYAHLSAIDANTGDRVRAGKRIASIGASGRVTGPHLHFSVYLNASAVDPELFIS
ncbi:MAG TPA: peptidoglycan DD-metalloendopeptidase family protein [Burkholderiales bacterium]|jgi:murein DD-endopeptidase MepM/ murein hydrolase activator NlpD|nr:peptidoglycan DD-metalloendopeptidase family protein [Burkholderiales bacterium]